MTAPENASHVVVASPNKPRPDDPWALAIADSLRRTEISYDREGSGPGSRFEGELLEDVQARVAIAMMRARQAEEAAIAAQQRAPGADAAELVRRVREAWDAAFTGSVETAVDVRQAWIAVETVLAAIGQPQPAAGCRTCGGRGTLNVPDPGSESASQQACPDPAHHAHP